MAATVKVYAAYGATPTYSSVDTGDGQKVSFSRADGYQDTASPITVPGSGRVFSYLRYLCLYVTTGGGSSSLSNLKVAQASAPTAGLELHTLTGGQATYTMNNGVAGTAAGNYPANDAVTDGTAPANYTKLSSYTDPTYYTYDATGGAATNGAKCGKFCQLVAAVLSTYAGGGNANTTLPAIKFQYDEA